MSEEYIVDVDNLTIRFNMASEKVDNLKEYVIRLLKHQLMFQEFLALKDVNLKVKRGEAWGLIGTNGSGKSTLLKACCGILKPYKGSVSTKGTIAPLIELGAGFDMNMTARENVFLNGTVLGHSRKFMEEHFDEIIEFAELQDFLDVPIKNFSSGMQARLGFAELHSERNIAKLSIVGAGMMSNPGVAAKMFESLYNEGVNINMISTSEIRVTVLINEKDGVRAMNAVHDAFGLAD